MALLRVTPSAALVFLDAEEAMNLTTLIQDTNDPATREEIIRDYGLARCAIMELINESVCNGQFHTSRRFRCARHVGSALCAMLETMFYRITDHMDTPGLDHEDMELSVAWG